MKKKLKFMTIILGIGLFVNTSCTNGQQNSKYMKNEKSKVLLTSLLFFNKAFGTETCEVNNQNCKIIFNPSLELLCSKMNEDFPELDNCEKDEKDCLIDFGKKDIQLSYDNIVYEHSRSCIISIAPCKESFSKLYELYSYHDLSTKKIYCLPELKSKISPYFMKTENIIDYYLRYWKGSEQDRLEMLQIATNATGIINTKALYDLSKNPDYHQFLYDFIKDIESSKLSLFTRKALIRNFKKFESQAEENIILKNLTSILQKNVFPDDDNYFPSVKYYLDESLNNSRDLNSLKKRIDELDFISEKNIKEFLNKLRPEHFKIIEIIKQSVYVNSIIESDETLKNKINNIINNNKNQKKENKHEKFSIDDVKTSLHRFNNFKNYYCSTGNIKRKSWRFKTPQDYFEFWSSDSPLLKLSIFGKDGYLELLESTMCNDLDMEWETKGITDKQKKKKIEEEIIDECINDKISYNKNKIYEAYNSCYPVEFTVEEIKLENELLKNTLIRFIPDLPCVIHYFGPLSPYKSNFKNSSYYKLLKYVGRKRKNYCWTQD